MKALESAYDACVILPRIRATRQEQILSNCRCCDRKLPWMENEPRLESFSAHLFQSTRRRKDSVMASWTKTGLGLEALLSKCPFFLCYDSGVGQVPACGLGSVPAGGPCHHHHEAVDLSARAAQDHASLTFAGAVDCEVPVTFPCPPKGGPRATSPRDFAQRGARGLYGQRVRCGQLPEAHPPSSKFHN